VRTLAPLLCAFAPRILCAAALSFSSTLGLLAQGVELRAQSAVVLDAATGSVVFEKNPDLPIPPASLAKLMTMHIALCQAAVRGIPLDRRFELPPESWWRNQPPRSSLMYLEEGQKASLRELLLGLAIPSGNDAAVAVALRFAPTIEDFAAMMNREARKFRLDATHFVEPSGISEDNITTARDFARFCKIYLQLHPEASSSYHTVEEFVYPTADNMPPERRHAPPIRVHRNHAGLVGSYAGADGLKTGYIDEAGYNLAASAGRDGVRFIAVLLGVPRELGSYWGPRARDADGAALFDWAFERFGTVRLPYPPIPPVRVWKGAQSRVDALPVLVGQSSPDYGAFTVVRGRRGGASCRVNVYRGLVAPLPAGSVAGELTFYDEAGEIGRVPLLTAADVGKGSLPKRLWDAFLMLFQGK
jgi:D-alanyl-D-alanine carboxypeptidase (penicillin-binding protein 5/6)